MRDGRTLAQRTLGLGLAAGAFLAFTLPAIARADGAPPAPPSAAAAGETKAPPPTPAPGTKAAPPVEPGSAPGLYDSPTAEERWCEVDRCLSGIPDIRTPLYDPVGRYQIPWTGRFNPCERNWTVFGAETVTYDSNIFLSDRQIESDWISNSSVGVSYRREGAAFWTLATAALTASTYLDHGEQNNLNFYGNFEFGWKGAAAYATVADRLAFLQTPIVVRDDKFVIVNQNLDAYWQDTLNARVGYDCARWRAELAYEFDLFSANGGVITAYDHTDHDLRGRFDYYVSEKTSVGAYAGARFVPYRDPTQRDFDVWSFGGTFSWRPMSTIGFDGTLGGAWTKSSGAGANNSSVAGSLDVSWDATENASIFVGVSRSFEPSLGADDQIMDLIHVRAQAVLDNCWTLNASTGFQLGDTQGATADAAKDYTLFFLDVMVHRPVGDHWALDAGYQFRNQNSESNGIDYEQHRVTIGFSVSL